MVPTLIFQLRAVPLPVSTAASTALSAAPAPASTYLNYFYPHKYFPLLPRHFYMCMPSFTPQIFGVRRPLACVVPVLALMP